jgi:hypothetical protein
VGRKKSRRLSATEFDAVMCLIGRMSVARRAAARMALVEGRTGQSIASEFGWVRTAVNNAESAVWMTHQRFLAAKLHESNANPLPAGWGRVEITAPMPVLEQIKKDVRCAIGDEKYCVSPRVSLMKPPLTSGDSSN